MRNLNIAFITPEAVPYAKTGGLADISGVLPGLFSKMGHAVKMFLPLYREVSLICRDMVPFDSDIDIDIGGDIRRAEIFYRRDENTGVDVYFVGNRFFYDRQDLYREPSTGRDYEDNDERYIFFCRAVLEVIKRLQWPIDVYHCHDWQAALVPSYINTLFKNDPFFARAATVFTIHNLAYQGQFPASTFPRLGIDSSFFGPVGPFEFWGKVNFMKSAVIFSDVITTVSPTYAREIQGSNEFGMGLEGVLRDRASDLYGVLNGVDYDTWSPRKDKFIPHNFFINNLSGKRKNKLELLHMAGFPVRMEHPLFGMISRLDNQKGFDLIKAIMPEMMAMDLQFVLLGTGDLMYHQFFNDMIARYPDRFQAYLQFDNRMAHLIEAASDVFLMPSRYEPCGLNQMYSMRYGTVPLVRKVGGLADTVVDFNEENQEGTGFVFEEYSPIALLETIKRAIRLFGRKRTWYKIAKRGMRQDFSWENSARKYIRLYLDAFEKKAV
jgi:starch synthase